MASVALLAACSWVPDAVNPVSWYEGVADAIAGDDTADDGAEFPNLATVPEAPADATTSDEFAAVAEGLAADRDNAQYADDVIRRADDEVDGELAAAEPAATTEPTVSVPEPEPEATVSEVQAPVAEPEPEPAVVVAEAAPAPAEPLANTSATTQAVTQAVPAAPLPGADVTTLFNAAFAASGAKVLPGQAQAQVAAATTTAVATATRVAYGNPSRLVGSVGFAEGSARLGGNAKDDLLEIAYLYGATGGPIRIVGHASPTGSNDPVKRKVANLDIALDRALAVARELARLGIPADRMMVEAQPEAGMAEFVIASDGSAGDRRVDVFLGP